MTNETPARIVPLVLTDPPICDRCNGTGELVTARDYQGHELAVRACECCGGTWHEAAKEDDDDDAA